MTEKSRDELIEALSKVVDLLSKEEKDIILDIFEHVFDHKSFTGRSGTFYGYEGLGSIYWHMVSKLLLASAEVTQKSISNKSDSKIIGRFFDFAASIRVLTPSSTITPCP